MTFEEAIQKFDAENAKGRIPNMKTGTMRRVSDNERHQVVAVTRAGLEHSTGHPAVEREPIEPHAETLPEMARQAAIERGVARPRDYASRARLFLRVVEGRTYKRQRAGANRLMPEWKRALEQLRDLDRTPASWGWSQYVIRLQNAAREHGVRVPEDLPGRDIVERWLRKADFAASTIQQTMTALVAISETPIGETLPDYRVRLQQNERGVRSLDGLSDRLADAGVEVDPLTSTPEEITGALAPEMLEAADLYLGRANPSAETRKKVRGSVSRLVAALARLGRKPQELSLVKVFEPSIEVSARSNSLVEAELGDARKMKISLMEKVLRQWAPESAANSPLTPADGVDGGTVWFTEAVRGDFDVLFRILQSVYGEDFRKDAPARWLSIVQERKRLVQMMKDTNSRKTVRGHKNKAGILHLVTLPQLIVIGLPAVWRTVRDRRDRYFQAFGRHDDRTAPAVHRMRTHYHTLLQDYLLLALLADDGLRISNYAGARMGRNIALEVARGLDDSWKGITSIQTIFRGSDPEPANLKYELDRHKRERMRERQVNPAVVDHELLLDYVLDARPYRLVRAGLLDAESEFDPDDDSFALFVSPNSSRPCGRYSVNALARRAGRLLYDICSQVLDRKLPPWKSEALQSEWRGVFAPHIVRLLIGTYWGGIRGDWGEAEFLTNDYKGTLIENYDASGKGKMRMKFKNPPTSMEHPQRFDDLMDRVRRGERIDWNQENVPKRRLR